MIKKTNVIISGDCLAFDTEDKAGDIILSECEIDLAGNYPLLYAHDWARPLGKIQKLRRRTIKGIERLHIIANINLEIMDGKEAYLLIKNRDIDGLSIGFKVLKYTEDIENGIREIHRLRLCEISVVSSPLNELTRIDRVDGNSL